MTMESFSEIRYMPNCMRISCLEKLGVHYSIISRHLRAIEKVKKREKWVPLN